MEHARACDCLKAALVAASLLATIFLPSRASAAGTAIVSVSAPAQTVTSGTRFIVNINVQPNTAIAGAQFSLSFNPSLISANSVSEGNLLKQGGASTYFMAGKIDNANGTVSGVTGTIVTRGGTVSTPGTLASIAFTAGTARGASPITLSTLIVGDVNGQAVTVSAVNGQVVNGQAPDNTAPPPPLAGGGGGAFGGGGGGIVASPDTTPPVISNVVVSGITRSGATIEWTTSEDSTSQVKYSAGTDNLSSSDNTVSGHHVVQLTSLLPYVTYHFRVTSQDRAGNLAESQDYSFATLGQPATFTVSGLEIGAARVRTNQAVIIKVTTANVGDADGAYGVALDVTSSNVTETMKRTIQLSAGASQEVSFTVSRRTAGVFQVSVNHLTDSFTVEEEPIPDVAIEPRPRISLFQAIPAYAEALRMASVRITYELRNPGGQTADAKAVLKVGLDGKPIEEIVVFSGTVGPASTVSGTWDYVPLSGWVSGTYEFHAELYSGANLTDRSRDEELGMQTGAPSSNTWRILALIVGAMLASACPAVLVFERRHKVIKT